MNDLGAAVSSSRSIIAGDTYDVVSVFKLDCKIIAVIYSVETRFCYVNELNENDITTD